MNHAKAFCPNSSFGLSDEDKHISPSSSALDELDSSLNFPFPLDTTSTSNFLGNFCNSLLVLLKFFSIATFCFAVFNYMIRFSICKIYMIIHILFIFLKVHYFNDIYLYKISSIILIVIFFMIIILRFLIFPIDS